MTSLKCKEICCVLYSCVLFLSGTFFVIFSVILSYKLFSYFTFVPSGTVTPFAIIFLLGFIHILLTWLAIRGPSKQHDFHIILFLAITVILILSEIGEGIWALVLRARVAAQSEVLLNATFIDYMQSGKNKYDWIRLEKNFNCCGLLSSEGCNTTISDNPPSIRVLNGCSHPLVEYLRNLLLEISLVGFLTGIFQILGVVVFYVFYKALKEDRISRAVNRATMLQRASGNLPNNSISATSARHSIND